jgi:hypothetical protein
MSALFDFFDGLPFGPILLFALGWIAFLLTVLSWFRSRHHVDACDRCGRAWQLTERGNVWHFCSPPGREYP